MPLNRGFDAHPVRMNSYFIFNWIVWKLFNNYLPFSKEAIQVKLLIGKCIFGLCPDLYLPSLLEKIAKRHPFLSIGYILQPLASANRRALECRKYKFPYYIPGVLPAKH